MSVVDTLAAIAKSGYLASIKGGQATWSAVSGVPLAVVAQQWAEPKILAPNPPEWSTLDRNDDVVKLNFVYHTQQDPDAVLDSLRRGQPVAR